MIVKMLTHMYIVFVHLVMLAHLQKAVEFER
jgi:hypothetical protein